MTKQSEVYKRAMALKNMLEYLMDSYQQIKPCKLEAIHFKLGECIYMLRGDKRRGIRRGPYNHKGE